jgi:NAD(P)-dependent dehydrogenase (short-subunit alcohol dehydrogenase family)
MNFKGRVALITGGGSGIGKATAQRLVERGATVLIGDVRPDGVAIAAEIGAEYVTLDVTDPTTYDAAFTRAIESHGRLDILHLNAGIQSSPVGVEIGKDGFKWVSPEVIRRVFAVNYEGVVDGVLAARHLDTPPADIIITASNASVTALPIDPVYASSKHAVIGFLRSTAAQLQTEGIRIQALCPGGTDTAIIPPDLYEGHSFAPPGYQAEAVINALENGKPGDVWMATDANMPYWTYTFPTIRRDPSKSGVFS